MFKKKKEIKRLNGRLRLLEKALALAVEGQKPTETTLHYRDGTADIVRGFMVQMDVEPKDKNPIVVLPITTNQPQRG